jgi:uncharacterized protein YjbJ (UPF0337 family)
MTDDRIMGAVKNGLGRVEDAAGGLTGDLRTQARGKIDQAAGAVQEKFGKAREQAQDIYGEVEDFAKAQPFTALAVTLGVGVVLGLLLRGRS